MKILFPIALLIIIAQAVALFATAKVDVQYHAPSEGHYVHGEHCMDSRVF